MGLGSRGLAFRPFIYLVQGLGFSSLAWRLGGFRVRALGRMVGFRKCHVEVGVSDKTCSNGEKGTPAALGLRLGFRVSGLGFRV